MNPKWLSQLPVEMIQTAADTHKLPWDLVAAIVMQESGGNSWKPRYEPGYKWLYFAREIADRARVSYATMVMMQSTSWGLMQVMGAVAYEYGLNRESVPTMLCLPHIGLDYGCRLLVNLFQRYNEEAQVISAYNAGSVRMVNGLFSNQKKYVDPVHAYLTELRALK